MERLFCNSDQLEVWWVLNQKYGTFRALQIFKMQEELETSINAYSDLDMQMVEEVNDRVCEDRPYTFSNLRDPNVDWDYNG